MKHQIYLDYNATAPIKPEIISGITAIMQTPHNASSIHARGREARRLVEEARVKIARLVNAPPAQVIFNSGATEGNNTVLKYFSGERILVSSIEHPSVLDAAPNAERIPVTKDGIIDLAALENLLQKEKTALVSVMFANNETGAIQPVHDISSLAKKYGALFHCDAVQACGKIPVDITGIDFLTLSSHKLGGPQGVGALVLGLCGITPTLLEGGGQEKKARPGTENVAGIHGFGMAAEIAARGLGTAANAIKEMRNAMEIELCRINNNIVIHAAKAPRLPGTSMFSVPHADSQTLVMAFDLEGICLSNGSACASGSVKKSHVLDAMNVDPVLAKGALRISLGQGTTQNDIDTFLKVFKKINERIKQ